MKFPEEHPDYLWLVQIRSAVRAVRPRFPENCCEASARAIEHYLGHPIVYGMHHYVDYPNLRARPPADPHCWNLDTRNQLYLDTTLHQFANKARTILPTILIAKPEDVTQLEPIDNPEYRVGPLDERIRAILDPIFAGRAA